MTIREISAFKNADGTGLEDLLAQLSEGDCVTIRVNGLKIGGNVVLAGGVWMLGRYRVDEAEYVIATVDVERNNPWIGSKIVQDGTGRYWINNNGNEWGDGTGMRALTEYMIGHDMAPVTTVVNRQGRVVVPNDDLHATARILAMKIRQWYYDKNVETLDDAYEPVLEFLRQDLGEQK